MRYTQLGTSGLQVSRLCFGTNGFGKPGHLAWIMGEAAGLAEDHAQIV